MSINEDLIRQTLIDECIKAKENAYCPYSKFRVGCALLTEDNKIITGCNVENASYGLSICAERTAICAAVARGYRSFKELAVVTDIANEDCSGPCGACRQFIAEFGLNVNVILIRSRNDYRVHSIQELLPLAFNRETLELERSTTTDTNIPNTYKLGF